SRHRRDDKRTVLRRSTVDAALKRARRAADARVMQRLRRPSSLLVAARVFVVACAGLGLARHDAAPRLSPPAAGRPGLDLPPDARALAQGERWPGVRVTPVDRETTRVSFFAGPRILAEAAVAADGSVERFVDHRGIETPYGAPLSHRAWLLALGCVAFA